MIEINEQNFPTEWNIPISNKILRKAIYEAFKGECFYSGRPLTMENMVIDHVFPVSKGGPDNIYNYVLCDSRLNQGKKAKVDEAKINQMLFYLSTSYVYKVKKLYTKYSVPKKPKPRKKPEKVVKVEKVYVPSPEIIAWYKRKDKVEADISKKVVRRLKQLFRPFGRHKEYPVVAGLAFLGFLDQIEENPIVGTKYSLNEEDFAIQYGEYFQYNEGEFEMGLADASNFLCGPYCQLPHLMDSYDDRGEWDDLGTKWFNLISLNNTGKDNYYTRDLVLELHPEVHKYLKKRK